MSGNINFINLDIAILALSSASLLGRCLYLLISRYKSDKLEADSIFTGQPYIIALYIILSYFIANEIGLPTINISSVLKKGTYAEIIIHSIEVIRFVLTLVLIWKEEGLLFTWLCQAFKNKLVKLVLVQVKVSFKTTLWLLIMPYFLPDFIFFPQFEKLISQLCRALMIWSFTWLIYQAADAYEAVILQKRPSLDLQNYDTRSLATKISITKKIFKILVCIVAAAASLMLFDKTKIVGTSIFASAGIVAGITSFAFKATIENFLCGLQIAFSQPIKINDAVIIQGEAGTIEEITLNYVIVKLWDLRRLVVPVKFFLENSFLNFSRNSTNIISSFYFITDHTIPTKAIREQFIKIVEDSPLWNKDTVKLQVTEINADGIKFRGIASTRTGGDAFDIKCEVLEKLNDFIVKNYPGGLPRLRIIESKIDTAD